MDADEILKAAARELADRETAYDPKGERSMSATVEAWSAITGREMSVTDGWVFMAVL